MKKKLMIAALTAIAMSTSVLAFTACGNDKVDDHVCGHVCPTCNKCTSDCTDDVCKDKCEGHEPETVDMTEGVYNCIQGGKYELLIKFYNDHECYFQSETTGYHAIYKIEEMQVTYAKTQDGGAVIDTDTYGDEAKWLTGNKVIAFYEADGTTPISYVMHKTETGSHNANYVPAGIGYAYGTPDHVLAYDEESDKIMSFRGEYGSRTLSHTIKNFTVNDEKAIEQAKFMVKTLPDGAEAEGKTVSDYFLTLSQKGYETNIPALEALGLSIGKFVQNGKVYNLTDTISGATATLTVTDTGATIKSGDTTLELVTWAEQNKPSAILTTSIKPSAAGGATVNIVVSLYEDGKVVVSNSLSPTKYTGTYIVEEDNSLTFNMDTPAQGSAPEFADVVYNKDTKVITGSFTLMGATGTLTGTASGELKIGTKTVVTITGKIAYGYAEISIALFDNGAVKASVKKTGSDPLVYEGTYIRNGNAITLTMGTDFTEKVEVTDVTVDGNKVTAKAKSLDADNGVHDIEGTIVEGTQLFAVILSKTDVVGKIGTNEIKFSITFYNNKTLAISSAALKLNGTYSAVSGKGLETVLSMSELTLTQQGLSLKLEGTVKGNEIAVTFSFTKEDLQLLLA